MTEQFVSKSGMEIIVDEDGDFGITEEEMTDHEYDPEVIAASLGEVGESE